MTICTKGRVPWFGEVVAKGMRKSTMGEIAEAAWWTIPSHFLDVNLDEFCLMPDHIHGLLEIAPPSPFPYIVGTQNFASLRVGGPGSVAANRFGPQSRNLASIVRGHKIAVTKNVRQVDQTFAWQPRFWGRVVRDAGEMSRIRDYIRANALHHENRIQRKETP